MNRNINRILSVFLILALMTSISIVSLAKEETTNDQSNGAIPAVVR